MASVLTEIPTLANFDRPRKIWTRVECERLDKSGVDVTRLELIEGELYLKMPKKRPHTLGLQHLLFWLHDTFGREYVQQEANIDVAPADNSTSEPEPDIAVLNRPSIEFPASNPQPSDIVLVAEVSDSSLSFDLRRKATLYARANIQEYWVLDVVNRRLIVHRSPKAGTYSSVIAYAESESVAPLAAPNMPFPVVTAFPTQPSN